MTFLDQANERRRILDDLLKLGADADVAERDAVKLTLDLLLQYLTVIGAADFVDAALKAARLITP